MNFKNIKINKDMIIGAAVVLTTCILIASVPWDINGGISNDTTEDFDIQTSAGTNSSINGMVGNTIAGTNGAVSGGTVGIVDNDKEQVGQAPDPEQGQSPEEDTEDEFDSDYVYETFGYMNLGIADVTGNLNVRKQASSTSAVVGKLTKYAACEIVEEADGWYKIISGKVQGYVSAEYIITGQEALKIAQTEASMVATVTTSSLRVRKEPSSSSKKLSNIAKGEEVYVEEIIGDWVKIVFDGYEEAYVSAKYVTIEKKLKTAQTIDEIRFGQISQTRIELVNYALKFVGNPYVWGGNSLTKGVDCSGFVQQVYKKFGISMPRVSRYQAKVGTKIKSSQAQPGDLFFYGDSNGINHVAIYIGNGKIVHAANKRDGIKISNAFYRTPKRVITMFND